MYTQMFSALSKKSTKKEGKTNKNTQKKLKETHRPTSSSKKGGEQAAVSHSKGFTMFVEVLWSLWLSEWLSVLYLFVRLSSGPATRQLSSFSFEGQHVPRSTDPSTSDDNTRPHYSESAQYEGQGNAESTNLQNYGEEGSLSRPQSSASTPKGDISPDQLNWSRNTPLSTNSML